MKKAFIEYDFPLKEVSEHSAREKNIRNGPISTLHPWWARRPQAASRATIYASLIPIPKSEKERKSHLDFIQKLANWDNVNNEKIIEKAKSNILKENGGKSPKVLDPFGGGGSIPFEALRLGCDVLSSDLNPVAVLIQKATIEYQRFNHMISKKEFIKQRSWYKDNENLSLFESKVNPLNEDLKYWSSRIYEEALSVLQNYYTSNSNRDLSEIVGFLWAREVQCSNRNCNADIPLIKQTWLRKRKNDNVAYRLVPIKNKIQIKIVQNDKIDFDPSMGTVSRAKVICPCCKTTLSPNETKSKIISNGGKSRLLIVIKNIKGKKGKLYELVETSDRENIKRVNKDLSNVIVKLKNKWDFEPLPNESIPSGKGSGAERAFALENYGFTKWADIFNPRQKLMLITFSDILKETYKKIINLYLDKEYSKALCTYLTFSFDRILGYGSTLCVLNPTGGRGVTHTFSKPTLSFTWDYMESNPFYSEAAGWETASKKNEKFLSINSNVFSDKIKIIQESATDLMYKSNSIDAIFTDPPYYDNIPYSGLSDFFYVWQKRLIGEIFPELFSTPLTPKSKEIVAYGNHPGGLSEGKIFFEKMLYNAFIEFERVLKPNGIANIVYAHKSIDAWETIIHSLLNAGLVITGSWPIHTERKGRLRSKDSAALASSIYMVCRKRNSEETAYYNEIKPAIEIRIQEKLDQFWAEGIGGSDFFISAIGPAVEVFGKYASVEKLSGEKVSVKELLEYVRQVVSEYALNRILKNTQLGGIDNTTRFYLIWRFTYGNAKVLFDDASKLSRAIGFDLEGNWDSAGIVKKDKQFITIKSPVDRRNDERFKRRIAKHFPDIVQETLFDDEIITTEAPSMIDVLHQCLIFWNRNDRLTIVKLLEGSGYRNNNHFWQVAQSISDVLKDGDKEKQLLQGFLYGKEGYQSGKVLVDDKPDAQEKIFGGDK